MRSCRWNELFPYLLYNTSHLLAADCIIPGEDQGIIGLRCYNPHPVLLVGDGGTWVFQADGVGSIWDRGSAPEANSGIRITTNRRLDWPQSYGC